MKLSFMAIAIGILLFTSFNLFASPGWSGKSKVISIYVLNETTALIKLESFKNPHNCNVDSNGHIILNPMTEKTWFTVILSAYMSGKEVDIYVKDSCGKTHWQGPTFANIGHVRLL